jgi:hypothetical protein
MKYTMVAHSDHSNEVQAAHYKVRSKFKHKKTRARPTLKLPQHLITLNDTIGHIAPEVCGGLSPQQINPIKLNLAAKLTKVNGPPPHSIVLFGQHTRMHLSGDEEKVVGVVLEDASPKNNPHCVVATSGLVSLACPVKRATSFSWGDFVKIVAGDSWPSGFDVAQAIQAVVPTRDVTESIGRFAGWPQGDKRNGGILVLLNLNYQS